MPDWAGEGMGDFNPEEMQNEGPPSADGPPGGESSAIGGRIRESCNSCGVCTRENRNRGESDNSAITTFVEISNTTISNAT